MVCLAEVTCGRKKGIGVTGSMIHRKSLQVNGIVQGVGFRPFVYRLAHQLKLAGFVNNNSNGVTIEIEGTQNSLAVFIEKLRNNTPPLAQIAEIAYQNIPVKNEKAFQIITTSNNSAATTNIAPDVSVCDDCLEELFDPGNRRYRYPFINCTNCGPRYTIVKSIPYDRPFTSMSVFKMCPQCQKEYDDPLDRRFHAQPNSCPECGPKLTLLDRSGKKIDNTDSIEQAVKIIRNGSILALRGLGGFHLAVDAFNKKALQKLRARKGRQDKPFALMALNTEIIAEYCFLSESEKKHLNHYTRPILILRKKQEQQITDAVAPNNKYLGFMLPYTPLHYLLLQNFELLVMTSANFTDEPITIANDESLDRLGNIADYFLIHNREIEQRCDDSIIKLEDDQPFFIRRSRGFVPVPVQVATTAEKSILAVGGELKNTVAISRGNDVFLSQHIGDLDNPAAYKFFENSISHLKNILQINPEVIVCDKHPEYLSTKWAKQQSLTVIEVQHHHAHLAAVMADNGVTAPTIGLILDGTGFGDDGTIWGGEVLIGDYSKYERFAWLEQVALPGGIKAIQQPWRMAFSYLYKIYGNDIDQLDLPIIQNMKNNDIILLKQIIDKGINTPLTSSCGRLFDAVSALLGICTEITFDAQAAIDLEMTVDEKINDSYTDVVENFKIKSGSIPTTMLIQAVVSELLRGISVSAIAAMFHNTIAELFLKTVQSASDKSGIKQVGLSGGVYQNSYLNRLLQKKLNNSGFTVLVHKNVPANDGGLALGQIAIAQKQENGQ